MKKQGSDRKGLPRTTKEQSSKLLREGFRIQTARIFPAQLRGQAPSCCVKESGKSAPVLHPEILQRVRWRCRRGLLELDIIFGRFVEAHYAQLNESEQQIFDELLDMPDNPLWDMISGRRMAETDAQAALLEKIKSV